MAETQEHWIDLGPGRRVRCEEAGRGPAVVYLPGNGCSTGDIGPLREAIIREHRYIGIDFPGRGPTLWPDEPFDFLNDLSPMIGTLLERLGVGEHAVIGHSMGGMLALQHARHHRAQVRGLILLEGFVSLAVHYKTVAQGGFKPIRMPAPILEAWKVREAANRQWLAARPTFARTFRESQDRHDARPWVAGLGLPILFFLGSLGQKTPPLEDGDAWRRHIGMEGVADLEVQVVPNAGHWMMLDDPPAVEGPVMRFLQRVLPRNNN